MLLVLFREKEFIDYIFEVSGKGVGVGLELCRSIDVVEF